LKSPSGVTILVKAAEAMTQRSKPHLRVLDGAVGTPTDADLCAAFAQGDEAAFGTLVKRHQDLVYAVVRRYAGSADDARELAQRAFIKAFQALRRPLVRLRHGHDFPFRAWVLRIAINAGKNHVRQSRRWRSAPLTLVDEARAAEPSPLEALERSERERLAREAVVQLPKRQREVLTLRVDGGLPFAEIAQTLGITENNAKVHFHHAAKRLRALVAPHLQEGRPNP
jgi:RNA polymerase sigma-70 factor (ECF subfamily)